MHWPYHTDSGRQEGRTSGHSFVVTMLIYVIVLTRIVQSTAYHLGDSCGGM